MLAVLLFAAASGGVATAAAPTNAGHPAASVESSVEGSVLQFDSLLHLETNGDKALYMRALARVAHRLEPGKVRSRNRT